MGGEQVWTYDRPLRRDPLAWVALAIWLVGLATRSPEGVGLAGALARAVLDLGGAVLGVGVVGGSVREYVRARRGQTA